MYVPRELLTLLALSPTLHSGLGINKVLIKRESIEGRGVRAGFYDPPLIHTYIHTYTVDYVDYALRTKFFTPAQTNSIVLKI
jgi:hypothetical protein